MVKSSGQIIVPSQSTSIFSGCAMDDTLVKIFLQAQQFALQSKLTRWTQRPVRYAIGLAWSYICYPLIRRGLPMRCTLFTGDKIAVPLPAGLDLFLTGVKSHPSELRLVRYILATLRHGDVAIDAGAHLGYFSLVMAACVSEEGMVIAFEPSVKTGDYLRKNCLHKLQVRTEQMMLSSAKGESTFHEYSLRYSEFNTSIHRVSEKHIPSVSRVVQMTSLDEYCKENTLTPVFIKIDVEGGEYNILKGAVNVLEDIQVIAMELRKNDYHVLYAPAVTLLEQCGFAAHRIDDAGRLVLLTDVAGYIESLSGESDNVVFRRVAS